MAGIALNDELTSVRILVTTAAGHGRPAKTDAAEFPRVFWMVTPDTGDGTVRSRERELSR